MLLHLMVVLNFTLILLGSPQLDTPPLGIPHEQGPRGPSVGLGITNPPSAGLPGSVSPKHCIADVKNFFSQQRVQGETFYEFDFFFAFLARSLKQ